VLRERLADWYSARGLATDPAQVIITGGALAALNLITETVLDPGDRVLVESPSYPNALEALRRRGARLIGAPMAEPGLALRHPAGGDSPVRPQAGLPHPDFHNPTGRLMSAEAREQLGRMLRRERCRPVIDETLVELNLDGADMPPPFAAGQEDAITIGSASKTFWGGLRIGWIRAPHALVRPLVEARATGRPGRRGDRAAGARLSCWRPRPEIVAEQQKRMRAGRDHLLQRLAAELPEWRVVTPGGGQTLWVELGRPVSSELAVAAAAHGVIITPWAPFLSLRRWAAAPALAVRCTRVGAHRGGDPARRGVARARRFKKRQRGPAV
jgi:DNA-binding transcriptional MocR family regulator